MTDLLEYLLKLLYLFLCCITVLALDPLVFLPGFSEFLDTLLVKFHLKPLCYVRKAVVLLDLSLASPCFLLF